jgi:hypothetical protein
MGSVPPDCAHAVNAPSGSVRAEDVPTAQWVTHPRAAAADSASRAIRLFPTPAALQITMPDAPGSDIAASMSRISSERPVSVHVGRMHIKVRAQVGAPQSNDGLARRALADRLDSHAKATRFRRRLSARRVMGGRPEPFRYIGVCRRPRRRDQVKDHRRPAQGSRRVAGTHRHRTGARLCPQSRGSLRDVGSAGIGC